MMARTAASWAVRVKYLLLLMEKNTSKRRTDIAAETIGKQIVRGKLSIGQVLPNDQVMCETLGISRTILREALRILGAKGLVKAVPKAGTFVNDTDKWAMLDTDILGWLTDTATSGHLEPLLVEMIDIRLAIEPGAAALTASRAHAADRQRISELFQSLKFSSNFNIFLKLLGKSELKHINLFVIG